MSDLIQTERPWPGVLLVRLNRPDALDAMNTAGLRVQQHIASLVETFRGVRAPVIAAVNGAAAGGGMALALMADIRIMAHTAALHASFINRGLSNCDIGVSWLLPRMIGFSRAAQILLTGRSVDADEAQRIGIVSSVEPADRLLDAALNTAEVIAGNSPFGVWMTEEPTEMVEDVALVGPADKICEDIVNRWKPTCPTTLILGGRPRPESREQILEAVRS
ncbi:enoyl-CoA hydratase-related protein [Nocardia jinanensis]|uniref:Enoyl-CoA hydratase/isomerase family protein n=1 Tax=Nocardia jinanensis TaxID=382504 RepID=A0A917VV23_9NOCA|nr:enoyl-CoA hydratase-related protein [Nocardia jinanensis]GGL16838.1 hypothetical protein GCM10011588_34400 [Nocardia jinanensis]